MSLRKNRRKKAIQQAIEREEELFQLVQKFVKRKSSLSSFTMGELRRWQKLMKNKTPSEQKTMQRMYVEIRDEALYGEPDLDRYGDMEEIVVIGSIFDRIELDPAAFSVDQIRQMRGIRMFANQSYRDGQYDEAYPVLLQLAKRGFKDAQSRLAYILFNGTDEVEKSNLRALGWLGVAAYGRTEPKFRVLFKQYRDQIPEYARPVVDRVVAAYRKEFAHEDHISCSTEHRFATNPHFPESFIKRTYCQFKLEAIEAACEEFECWANRVNEAEQVALSEDRSGDRTTDLAQ